VCPCLCPPLQDTNTPFARHLKQADSTARIDSNTVQPQPAAPELDGQLNKGAHPDAVTELMASLQLEGRTQEDVVAVGKGSGSSDGEHTKRRFQLSPLALVSPQQSQDSTACRPAGHFGWGLVGMVPELWHTCISKTLATCRPLLGYHHSHSWLADMK